jgi:hypothetical protein
MTRDDILAMEPGREMDELVEFKVMGTRKPAKGFVINPKHYSTSISAAWEVVEKFPLVDVSRCEFFEGNVTHEIKMWVKLDEDAIPYELSAKTAPEAICKAALLAVLDL